MKGETIAICFGQFGPYHHARVAALQEVAEERETGDGEQGTGERTGGAGDGEMVGMWESGKVMSRQSSVGSGEVVGVTSNGSLVTGGEKIGVSEGGVSEGGGEAWSGKRVIPVQISSATATYEWESKEQGAGKKVEGGKAGMSESEGGSWRSSVGSGQGTGDKGWVRGGELRVAGEGEGSGGRRVEGLRTLCAGVEETVSPVEVFFKARRLFRDENVGVAFLPSYSPARYLALFLAAKSLGLRTVMMNESHAGTERATGWKKWIKRQIVRRFDAALVGGEPHRRHFASLGIPEEKIFTGYDAVDGAFFAQHADEIRSAQRRCNEWLVTGGGEQGTGERTGCAVTGNGSLVAGGEEIGVSGGGVSEAGVSEAGVSETGGEAKSGKQGAGSGEEGTGDRGQGTGDRKGGVSEDGGDSAISAFDLAFRRARFAAVAALQSVFLRSAQRFSVSDFRNRLGLPERYFLSLGRFVEKKNLATLVEAYARFASGQSSVDSSQGERRGGVSEAGGEAGSGEVDAFTRDQLLATRYPIPALVFVGSGEEEAALREQVRGLGLRVVERTGCGVSEVGVSEAGVSGGGVSEAGVSVGGVSGGGVSGDGVSEGGGEKTKEEGRRKSVEGGSGAESRDQLPVTRHEENCGAVFFYGFRQIEENAIFYALAEAFVLPSKYEEWGLVVNEAMACSLPVIVSRTAGCAEDLLPASGQVASGEWRAAGGERTRCAVTGDGSLVTGGEEIGVSEGGVSEGGVSGGGGEAGSGEQGARSGEWGAGSGGRGTVDRSQGTGVRGQGTVGSKLTPENSLERRSNGFVFDPMSVDALAEALRRIARMDEAERRRMGECSREIVARFSCENFARQAMAAAAAAAI